MMTEFRNPGSPGSAPQQAGMYYARKRARLLRIPPPVVIVAPMRVGLTKMAAFKKDISIISHLAMGMTVTAQESICYPVAGTVSLGLTETAAGDCHILAPAPTFTFGLTETAKITAPPVPLGGAVGTAVDLPMTTPLIPAGALIVVGTYNQASHVPTVTDSAGNTYTRLAGSNGCQYFYCPNCLSVANGGWINTHDAAGAYQGIIGAFLMGMATSSVPDGGVAGSSGTSTNISLSQGGRPAADDWWVDFGVITGNITITSYPAGWIGVPRVADATATMFMAVTQAVGTGGVGGNIIIGSGVQWFLNKAAFKHA